MFRALLLRDVQVRQQSSECVIGAQRVMLVAMCLQAVAAMDRLDALSARHGCVQP